VQVLEGPAWAIRPLFFGHIYRDPRHTAVKRLWDIEVRDRRYDGFGMKVASHKLEEAETVMATGDPSLTPQADVSAAESPRLLRLTYTSRLLARGETAYRLMLQVVRISIGNNPKLGIGGVLFFNRDTCRVLQVLEGPPEAVLSLYHDKIAKDLMHEKCTLLSVHPVSSRQYNEWGMLQGEMMDWSLLETPDWLPPRAPDDDEIEQSFNAFKAGGDAADGAVGIASASADANSFGSSSAQHGRMALFRRTRRQRSSKENQYLERLETSKLFGGLPKAQEQMLPMPPILPRARLVVGPEGPVVGWDEDSIGGHSPERKHKFQVGMRADGTSFRLLDA